MVLLVLSAMTFLRLLTFVLESAVLVVVAAVVAVVAVVAAVVVVAVVAVATTQFGHTNTTGPQRQL